jgi:alpha-glucosidase (family GH31 glycosyl hydrolase)
MRIVLATVIAVLVAATPAAAYTVKLDRSPFALTTVRGGKTVMRATGLTFQAGGAPQHATQVLGVRRAGRGFDATVATTSAAHTIALQVRRQRDRYRLTWHVVGAGATDAGMVYDLASSGHWYGHGEVDHLSQPWPLDSGQVHDDAFGPASYKMIDPFWFTSRAAGLWVDTADLMDVSINQGGDGSGRFTVGGADAFAGTVFVERTPHDVYRDYVGIAGKPEKSDATERQLRVPLWNTWGQYYTSVDQDKVRAYADGLAADGVPGHTVQIDDKWESNYGNFTFDTTKFPDPAGLSEHIHGLGFDVGLWVTLWLNIDSQSYPEAAAKGYLLMDGKDPSKVCNVEWWNGTAGIVDLANPDARAWYEAKLRDLMERYGIDGFKFDTRFFDEKCKPRDGFTAADYIRLGADLADQFDLQGAGVRIHWTGSQKHGFVIRQLDKGTGWDSLKVAVTQDLAISTVGYPFVETDMIGGSLGQPPPQKDTLVRWAQAASLMPLMYSSTTPVGYDAQTVALYKRAIATHRRLGPYLDAQVRRAVATGEPIMKPLFFAFPREQRTYTITDEWLLGDAVLAAPVVGPGTSRDVYLPRGRWVDVNGGRVLRGPVVLHGYDAGLGVTPTFVRRGARNARTALSAFR